MQICLGGPAQSSRSLRSPISTQHHQKKPGDTCSIKWYSHALLLLRTHMHAMLELRKTQMKHDVMPPAIFHLLPVLAKHVLQPLKRLWAMQHPGARSIHPLRYESGSVDRHSSRMCLL